MRSRTFSIDQQRQLSTEHRGNRDSLQATVSAKVRHAGRRLEYLIRLLLMHEEVEAGDAGRQEKERHVEEECNEVVCNGLPLRLELQLRSHRPLLRCHIEAC